MIVFNIRDLEEELFETIASIDSEVTILFDFLEYYGDRGLERFATSDRLIRIASKYNINQTWDESKHQHTFCEVKSCKDNNLIKTMFLSWMTGKKTGKNIILGRALGHFLENDYVPDVYRNLLLDAQAKVTVP